MRRMRWWVIAAALLAVAVAGAGRAPGQTSECASLGEAANWDVFANGDLTMSNTTLAGRAAARGTVTVSQISVGGQTPSGLDLVAGGDLKTNGGGGTVNGDVRYGGTRPDPTALTITGTATQGAPPFSFPAQFTDLAVLSSSLGEKPDTAGAGYAVNPYSHAIEFAAPGAGLNVINLDGTKLATAAGVVITAAATATVLINVTGPPSLSVPLGYTALSGGIAATRVLWNLSGVQDFTLSGNGQWEGTLLAPSTTVRKTGGGQNWDGQVIAASADINSLTVLHAQFAGCLPAPRPLPTPAPDLDIAGLCVEKLGRLVVRLRNRETHAVNTVAWADRDSAVSGTVDLPASSDHYFAVDGGAGHTIVATKGDTEVSTTPVSRACAGTIRVTKRVLGTGPGGAWPIGVFAPNEDLVQRDDLADGESFSVTVPGGFATGVSVPIGEAPSGVAYSVRELDTRGAIVTISRYPVMVTDSPADQPIDVLVSNDCGAGAACATPTPEPTVTPSPTPTVTPTPIPTTTPTVTPAPTVAPEPTPTVFPDQPVLPPGAPDAPVGPDLVPGAPPAADLAVTNEATPQRLLVGQIVSSVSRVRNQGTRPANGVVARELPQYPNTRAAQVARVVSLSVTRGTCTHRRPIRCELGTLRPNQVVTIRARSEVRLAGRLESVIFASGTTPETNTTNNQGVSRLIVTHRPFRLRVRVSAPPIGSVGSALSYRVSVTPSSSARAVRLCTRVPPSFTGVRAAHTFRYRRLLCRNFAGVAAGASPGFVVRAVPAAGGSIRLPAVGFAPDAVNTARGSERVRIGRVACAAVARRSAC
jgi:choice-of-anchor A domain-containing protein